MKKCTKALSIVMALIMVLGVFAILPVTVSAAGESVNDVTKMYDFMVANDTDSFVKNMLVAGGASADAPYESYKPANLAAKGYTTTAPTLDGVVDNNEYQITRNTYATTAWHYSDHKGGFTESFSYDEENLYLGFTLYSWNSGAPIRLVIKALGEDADKQYQSHKLVVKDSGSPNSPIQSPTRVVYLDLWSSGWLDDFESSTGTRLAQVAGSTYAKHKVTDNNVTVEYKLPFEKIAAMFNMEASDISTVLYAVAYGTNGAAGWNPYGIVNSIGNGAAKNAVNTMAGLNEWSCLPKVITLKSDMVTSDSGSIRYEPDRIGLRFKTTISKAYIEELEAAGYTNIQVGTLIAPTDTIGAGKTLTKLTHDYGTAGENMLDIPANLANPYREDANSITFTGAIVGINPGNIGRDFSAVGYVSYETDGGTTVYVYSDFVAERNVSEIASAAIAAGECDGDATKLAKYQALVVNDN